MKKYIFVLLTVFVLGMMASVTVEAAPNKEAEAIAEDIQQKTDYLVKKVGDVLEKSIKETLMLDVDEPVKTLEDSLIIEGTKNLKVIEQGESGHVTGEFASGQKIRLHYYEKKYPLSQVNEKRRNKGLKQVESYNWNCTIVLKAKNEKNQVVKEITKNYKNTRDNILEFQTTEDVTSIEIKISDNHVGYLVGDEKPHTGSGNTFPIILSVNGKLKPVAIASVDKTGKDSNIPDGVEQDDLPDSDAAKAAAAVVTALGGALLGTAGAVAGTIGGAGGGVAGGAAGNVSGDYGGYDLYDDNRPAFPDNVSVADDGSIRVTAPTGETLVYTLNADGSYNSPTHTESGEALTWQDDDGNWHGAESGTLSQKEILEGAQWYKDNEQAIIADRAEEDARQQAERDRLAKENAAWLKEQHEINNQKSWLSSELEKELERNGLSEDNREFIEKMREQYAHGDKSLSKDEIKNLIKKDVLQRTQIYQMMEGAYYDQEAAEWDDKLVKIQVTKFAADQAVNAYGMLSGNQAFANGYSALTNYTETMTDAVVYDKDKGKAFLKATIDTALDITANKFESYGWGITGNAFSGAYKQVNDNLYNGRDAWEDTDKAAVRSGLMGVVSKGLGKLKEKSQGTVFGQEIGGTGTKPKVNTDIDTGSVKPKPKVNTDAGTGSVKPKPGAGTEPRKTTIAERRSGQGRYKTEMSEADAKMRTSEDVQANRSMNDVRKLNDISNKMSAMEKANPKTFQNDPKYQKLSQQFDSKARDIRGDKVATDRMNALQGKTGTDLRQRYNKSDMEFEKKILQHRNESIAAEKGLKTNQIGDMHVSSNKDSVKAAGGSASHDMDTSPYQKLSNEMGKQNVERELSKSTDFTQPDGDYHLAKAVYKAEHGRFPQTAAEYDDALKLKEKYDLTNVSTRPSDTHEIHHNPDAYVGSGKGEVKRVLEPGKYGTPEKGTGVLNEQTAIHKQGTPLKRHQEQYAEAQKLREQLKTDKNLSAAEKTETGKKIADLERKSASNHYESTRTTAKEAKIISDINDVNIKNGLGDGMSDNAKKIGDWANQVREGKMSNDEYKQLVTQAFGDEKTAQKILANGFRTVNK